jgi:hypothetical protein
MADRLYYVYGIVPPSMRVAGAPRGVDDTSVETVVDADVAALIGRLDPAMYGPNVDDLIADVAWLGPRASAHDAVLTWASDAGPVVPLPILSLFRSELAVRAMLGERGEELGSLLRRVARGREYGVRIFRVDDELRATLATFSPSIAALEAETAGATSPGQGYLLSRKLDAARKDELHRVASAVATTAYHALASRSLEATQEPLPKSSTQQLGAAVLNAAFLVAHDRVDDFRAAVTEFVRQHGQRGFRVEFTGPWPPYHFTRIAAHVG